MGERRLFMDIQLWRKRKKELGYTFDDIAILSGVSRRTVVGIFNGEILAPRIDSVDAIETVLGIKKFLPPDITEGKQEWIQLYDALTDENRDLLVKLIFSFKDMPPERRRFVLDAIRLAIPQK
jgi:transcriptional regulator with XRE-family HTH domain